jgi:adenylosuccinate lyase
MIKRYTRPEMGRLWEDRNRYLIWLEVEIAVCEQLASVGKIARKDWRSLHSALKRLQGRGGVAPERVEEIEKVTRHDVIAFTTAVAEEIGPLSRYFHYGLTSSDVVDTALSLNCQKVIALLLSDVDQLLEVLWDRALEFRDLPTIGRTHGMFAEPTSFGLKFLSWAEEWKRNRSRLLMVKETLRFGKLSGAVGASAHWSLEFEERVLARLGLKREPVSTQILPRDRHAELLSVIALCGSSLERMAVELRHLQRSEVGEVMEGFSPGQKGSSAMPHKRNPISSENITGLSRLMRSYALAGLENVALWHERDISHSSVERVTLSDATILLDYALARMTSVIKTLVVDREKVARNLKSAGSAAFSGHILLALTDAGVSRELAYEWVQQAALSCLDRDETFEQSLLKNEKVRLHLSESRIRAVCQSDFFLRNTKAVFKLAGKPKSSRTSQQVRGALSSVRKKAR